MRKQQAADCSHEVTRERKKNTHFVAHTEKKPN